MDDMLSPLERTLTAQIEETIAAQESRILALETQVEQLMTERERMRSMLDFFEQLNRAGSISRP